MEEVGEIVALVGESGTGETTLIRILNSLIPADRGYVAISEARLMSTDDSGQLVLYQGKNVRLMTMRSVWFQDYQLFPI